MNVNSTTSLQFDINIIILRNKATLSRMLLLVMVVVVDIFLHIVCQAPLVLSPHNTCIHKPKPECRSHLEEWHRFPHTLGCRPNPIFHLQAYNALEEFESLLTNTFHLFYYSIIICFISKTLTIWIWIQTNCIGNQKTRENENVF